MKHLSDFDIKVPPPALEHEEFCEAPCDTGFVCTAAKGHEGWHAAWRPENVQGMAYLYCVFKHGSTATRVGHNYIIDRTLPFAEVRSSLKAIEQDLSHGVL